MKKYRVVSFVLAFAVLLSTVCFTSVTVSAATGTAPQKGTGTSADPYIIDEPLELVWMSENYGIVKDKYFQQTADIDMSSVANFTPIGDGTTGAWGTAFSGQYDGLGFSIRNLTISSDLAYFGLFQYLSGAVRNVILEGADFTSVSTYNYATIGGIAGYCYNGTISNCGVSGNLSLNSSSSYTDVGGVCGQCSGAATITNSFCTADLTTSVSNESTGGITAYTGSSAVSVNHCYFAGTMNSTPRLIGAIIANNYQGTFSNNVYLDSSASYGLGNTATDAGCTRATISQMKTTAPYLAQGWDFVSLWKMDSVTGYPTFSTTPGAPANVTVQSGNSQITVSWNSVLFATDYKVYYGTASGTYGAPVTVSGTSTVITGLTNMTPYYICVKSLHGTTEGGLSAEVTGVPHVIISDLTAAGSLSSVILSFSAPTAASAVELQQSIDGGSSYTAVFALTNSSTGVTLTGLASRTYYFRLKLTFAGVVSYSNIASAFVGGSYTKEASEYAAEYDESICAPAPVLYPGCYYGEIDDAALKFNLSDCAGSVKNAYLYVYVVPTGGEGNAVLNLYGMQDDSWSGTIMPADPNGSNSTLIQAGIADFAAEKYIKLDITNFVKAQFAAGDKTLSFYFAGQLTAADAADYTCFYSPDNAANKPYLDIAFSSTNANLSGIKINGTNLPGFTAGTNSYSYIAPHDSVLSALSFTSTLEDASSTQSSWVYTAANHTWSVTVTAPDTTTVRTYTVDVSAAAQSSDATLSSISVGGTAIAGFSPAVLNYTYTVAHGADGSLLSLSSVVHDHMGIQGSWSYDSANKKWSVTVTSEDGSAVKTYTVTVNELPSTDASLTDIKIGGTAISGFSSATYNYTYDVVHGTDMSALALTSTFSDHMASGSWAYNAVTHKWSITVTAQDTTTKLTYTISINELPSTDAALSDIKIGGTSISGFSSATYNYTYDVVHGTDMSALALTSTFSDHMASGTWAYDSVSHKWSITVTAEDTTTKLTYTVTINELPSTDAALSDIKIGGTSISGFSSSTYIYTYDVAHGTNGALLSLSSVAHDHNGVPGSWSYDTVNHKWSITVTAEDTTTKLTYTVTVNELPSTDAALSDIKIGGTSISGFSSSTYNYTYDVVHGTDMSALVLTSTFSDHMASGSWVYDSTNHKWSITVTAEDGTTKLTYIVTINELPSTDATLNGITVGGTLIGGFSASTYNYTYKVGHGTDMSALVIVSRFNDHMASGSWSYDAAAHTWSITCTAEDGTTKLTYMVTINELPSTDAALTGIKIGGTAIGGFSSSTYDYTCDVVHGTDMSALVLTSTFSDHMAGGTWSYDAASQKWSIIVTAEDGTTKLTYTVTINELPSTDAALTGIKIGGTAISGFSSSTYNYTYDVVHGTDMSALSLTSTFSDHMAGGIWSYDSAAHAWSITVTAEDTTTKLTYAVTINELPSTDATLKSIKIDGTDLVGFTPAVLNYTYTVIGGTNLSALVLLSEANDHMAKQGVWIYDAATKTWSVTVTAEDNLSTKTYTVAVHEFFYPVLPKDTSSFISYQSHVQDVGWQGFVNGGAVSGTSAQSKRMEAIHIKLDGIAGGIEYCSHVQDIGWMGWVADGAMSGTSGQSKRLEAIRIRLTGDAAEKYDIYYRVHAQDVGWMDWAKNGEAAGTAGYSRRLEAVEIVLVPKGGAAPGATIRTFLQAVK